jgi:hypothetical protein
MIYMGDGSCVAQHFKLTSSGRWKNDGENFVLLFRIFPFICGQTVPARGAGNKTLR